MTQLTTARVRAESDGRPLSELRDSGLLWLINASVFHPRGLGLALHFSPDGEAIGWSFIHAGDGEPFGFPDDETTNEKFRAAERTLAAARTSEEVTA